MSKTEEREVENTVSELNQELYDPYKEEELCFWSTSNGFVEAIMFEKEVLWDSENDGREFDEDKNDYEPMLPYIKKKFNEYADKLNSLKFKV